MALTSIKTSIKSVPELTDTEILRRLTKYLLDLRQTYLVIMENDVKSLSDDSNYTRVEYARDYAESAVALNTIDNIQRFLASYRLLKKEENHEDKTTQTKEA